VDLTDEQWEVLAPLIPEPPRRTDGRGRPWRDPRDVLNGILWVLRTGAPWHDLPERYPPYSGPATAASNGGPRRACWRRFFRRWPKTSGSGVASTSPSALWTAPSSGRKRGRIGWKDQAGQGYEAHGVGRPLWPSSRRARGECFAARGHARRSDARGEFPRRGARAFDRGPSLRLRPAGCSPPRAGCRDDRAAP
jgi:transposase